MIMAEIRLNGFAAEKDIVYIIGHFNYKVFEKILEKCENVFIHLSNCIYCHNSDYNYYCPKSISPLVYWLATPLPTAYLMEKFRQ